MLELAYHCLVFVWTELAGCVVLMPIMMLPLLLLLELSRCYGKFESEDSPDCFPINPVRLLARLLGRKQEKGL